MQKRPLAIKFLYFASFLYSRVVSLKKAYLLICFYLVLLANLVVAQVGFVTANGKEFFLNGKPFYFAGANNYYLFYKPLSTTQEVFNDAVSLNLTVIRTWGFNDGSGYMPFQSAPRSYNEATFQFFDRIIKEASDRNIRLIVPLVNNWDDFGGMCQYVRWCNLQDADQCDADEPWPFGRPTEVHDMFYTNDCTKQLYKDYVSYFLNRVNTLTGIKYKDTPAIFAWELANEPRCRSDTSTATLNNWIGEMSAYIKSTDPNHMVTPGGDGGYKDKPSDPSWSWWYHGNEGQDFITNHQWSNVDFATFRYYPEPGKFDDVNVGLWFQHHASDAHNTLGKPVIAEEFGSVNNKLTDFQNFYSLIESNNINGDLFWLLSDPSKPGNDGYFISCPEDSGVCNLIKNHASKMRNKSRLFVDFSIALKNGWNLISIPLTLDDSSVANLFSGIPYSGLFYYDNKWKVPANIESNKGYWVKVGGNYVMNIRGNPIESPDFNAGTEWKLSGYPYLEERDISVLPYNVAVYMYDNSNWYSYKSGRALNSMAKFKPGYGYWIKKI